MNKLVPEAKAMIADRGLQPAYNAADALLDGLEQMGVTHIFANLGSDHADIIEAMARRSEEGRLAFRVILCPHENVALAAAQGFTLMHGKPAAVFVHVDAGTQTMGGAIHNAWRGRAPVFIFAGETPCTIDGEWFGGRNRPPQILQDVPDQHGIIRSYVKWSMSARTVRNFRQLVYRGLQIALSEPQGPVYLTAAREIMAEQLSAPPPDRSAEWRPASPSALPEALVHEIVGALAESRKAVIVTAYAGRNHANVDALRVLAEAVGACVVEETPTRVNFPRTHPLHAGYDAVPVVRDADVILVLDCDVPWVNSLVSLRDDVRIYHLDSDPLKITIPLWHVPAKASCVVDSAVALGQLNAAISGEKIDPQRRQARIDSVRKPTAPATTVPPVFGTPYVMSVLSDLLDDDAIIVDETVTNAAAVLEGLPRNRPGTFFASGGAALGFGGGASIGVKLAEPERTVVCITGDGSYLFGVPSAVYMVSAQCEAPFLTVILNNGGWNATKQNVLRLRPNGAAVQTDHFWVNLRQTAALADIAAAAGGALAITVTAANDLRQAVLDGLESVRCGRSAVLDIRLEPISQQNV